jgi:hypothetical protein
MLSQGELNRILSQEVPASFLYPLHCFEQIFECFCDEFHFNHVFKPPIFDTSFDKRDVNRRDRIYTESETAEVLPE